jgi:outer membrane protein assembly factor BamA
MKFSGPLYLAILITLLITFNEKKAKPSVFSGQDRINDSIERKIEIARIHITGNNRTKEPVIKRELTFREGQILTEKEFNEALAISRRNLLRLPLFNFVSFEQTELGQNQLSVTIILEERWYFWPQVAIINNERNFNSWYSERNFMRLDYRLDLRQYNMFGLNHILRFGTSYGFTRELSLGYQNIAIGKKQQHFAGILGRISAFKTVFYRTFENKQEPFIDQKQDALISKTLRLEYTFRPGMYTQHRFFLSFGQFTSSDSLLSLNSNFIGGTKNKQNTFAIWYQLKTDHRDNPTYPLTGFYFDCNITNYFMGISGPDGTHFLHTRASVKYHYKLARKLYAAHSITTKKLIEGTEPYFFKNSLGNIDYLRGFEYYVIEGNDYYLQKNTIKFELLPQTTRQIQFIPLKKFQKIHYAFYLNAFADIGYAQNKERNADLANNLSGKLLYSFGLGFDLVTYYDKVIRMEYSINSLKEKGVFLHFVAPI